ncbi:hypothetical protein VTN00DRAFT_6303 [Thermoascus crustaceus]|uniref:uncharacterized protein n=1 Tax=Thermoascus crustaceus TaxID=5088 RepID=UPI00374412D4
MASDETAFQKGKRLGRKGQRTQRKKESHKSKLTTLEADKIVRFLEKARGKPGRESGSKKKPPKDKGYHMNTHDTSSSYHCHQ